MSQNIQQLVSDRIALELGRLAVSKIILQTENEALSAQLAAARQQEPAKPEKPE